MWNSGILLVLTARARTRVSRQPSHLRQCQRSLKPTGRSQPMCVVRDTWVLRTTHMERGRLSRHHRSRRWESTGPYLNSQATPSPSRSSSSRYPGSPRCKGAAPDSFAFLQLGKYVLSCFGSSAGAGAAAPPPAWVVASGVGSGSCVAGGAGDSDGGACVAGIGDGVGLRVGDGVGLGVGDGEGVGVGDGDGEAVTVGEGTGACEPASSATDGIPHPARPAQVAMAKAADADRTTIL